MSYLRITGSVTVDETLKKQIVTAVQALFDSFAIQRIAIFDSEITCISVSEIENADQVRRETEQP